MKYLLFFFLCLSVSGMSQTPFPNAGKVFNDAIIPKIYIEINEGDLNQILDPNNIGSDTHFPATFIFDNGTSRDTVLDIGFRLRGNTSQAAEKKSFKISFNTFESGRKYKGLEKMNINGEHNDPSVIRAKLGWDLCRSMGIIATRSNHVELYINGDYRGLYLNVEHIDEEFTDLRFGDGTGNLYKCLFPATLQYLGSNPASYKVASGGRRIYELKTNQDEDDYSDLAQFIDVLNNTPTADLPCELEKVFDVQNYLKVIAFDVLTGNWDGPIFNKNNFYLYHNPLTGTFRYIPYDVDNTFGIRWFGEWTSRNIYSWSPNNEPRPIYEKIIANDHYRAQYTYYMKEFLELYFTNSGFFEHIDGIKNKIEGSIPADPLYPADYGFSVNDFNTSYDQGLDVFHVPHGLKEYISLRRASAFNQLQSTNAAPIITEVQQQNSSANQEIFVGAKIENEGTVEATVEYNFNGQPGQAILYDDGQHNDGIAGDQIYGARLPIFAEAGTLEYYIKATDDAMQTNRFPFCETLEANVNFSASTLYLNEIQASNQSTITDTAGEYEDWIELYNGGTEAIDLSGFYLTDDLENLTRWPLPNEMIQAGDFLLIWADNEEDQGDFHANFKLNKDGETIALVNSFGNIVDQVNFESLEQDAAFGRLPNGTGIFQAVRPTPGASNEAILTNELLELTELSVLPNPFSEVITLTAAFPIAEIQFFNLMGQLVLRHQANATTLQVPTTELSTGAYVLRVTFSNGWTHSEKVIKN